METSRRSFLKVGAFAALALAAGGALYRITHRPAPQRYLLDGEAQAALQAIVPAILDGALPLDPAARAKALLAANAGVQQAILGLPLATQDEVRDLFALLALAPARRLLAGVADGWEHASVAQVSSFLQEWRVHRLGLLRTAYVALHDLVLGAWYANPASWAAIGYPGPLPELAG